MGVTVTCGPVSGPTDATVTTEAPCEDQYSNCPDLAKDNCFTHADKCPKSCGKCPGMTPAASNTCYDVFGNCPDLAKDKCYRYTDTCKKSCGLCEGMTPAASNTCYNVYSNCANYCSYSSLANNQCKKA